MVDAVMGGLPSASPEKAFFDIRKRKRGKKRKKETYFRWNGMDGMQYTILQYNTVKGRCRVKLNPKWGRRKQPGEDS